MLQLLEIIHACTCLSNKPILLNISNNVLVSIETIIYASLTRAKMGRKQTTPEHC